MRLVCIYQHNGLTGLWQDLKTVKGYLNRLGKLYDVTDFQIFQEDYTTRRIGRYFAIKAKAEPYYDYRVHEYRDRTELVNHDLAIAV